MEINSMTKKIKAHKAGLDNGIAENREETIKIIESMSAEKEKFLKYQLALEDDAEQTKG